MPIYKIIFEKEAQKFLDKQDKNKRLRLYRAIYKLPEGMDIKKLKEKMIIIYEWKNLHIHT